MMKNYELFQILNTTTSSVTNFKSFLVCRARTLLSFETKFNILFVEINIQILNNSFIIHELVNLNENFTDSYPFNNPILYIQLYREWSAITRIHVAELIKNMITLLNLF